MFAQIALVDVKAEEAAIRALIESDQRPGLAAGAVRWTGAYKRPITGSEEPDIYPDDAPATRRNQKTTKKIIRIDVAASGDMAWEYSTGTLEYDSAADASNREAKHQKFETATLRVWEKEKGQWKIAAMFVRPLDIEFKPF